MNRLASQPDADCLVVNTSGLLAGPGRFLKATKIQELQPDLVIALGGGAMLEALAGDWPALEIVRLPSSPMAKFKTKGQRRALRREAFRRYFEPAAMLRLKCNLLAPTAAHAPLPAGLLLGLSNECGSDLGLGLVVGSPDPTVLDVLSPVAEAEVARIVPGALCLDGRFSETPLPAQPPQG
jgi:polynucleotide 5'-hydroxyl-kinase GRC3/NOL9